MKFSAIFLLASLFFGTTVFASPALQPLPYAAVASVESTQVPAGKAHAPGGPGTGVLIRASGLILTNIHVIVACLDALGESDPWHPSQAVVGKSCPPSSLKISFPMAPGQPSIKGAKIVAVGKPMIAGPDALLADWILLSVNPDKVRSVSPVRLSSREISPGEPIRIAGFPSSPVGKLVPGSENMFETAGLAESADEVESIWKGIYSSLSLTSDQFAHLFAFVRDNLFGSKDVFFHDALVISGYSGSAVFDSTGDMVGLVFGNASTWVYDYGDYPDEFLGLDPSRPDKPANRMSTGIRLSTICRETRACQ